MIVDELMGSLLSHELRIDKNKGCSKITFKSQVSISRDRGLGKGRSKGRGQGKGTGGAKDSKEV